MRDALKDAMSKMKDKKMSKEEKQDIIDDIKDSLEDIISSDYTLNRRQYMPDFFRRMIRIKNSVRKRKIPVYRKRNQGGMHVSPALQCNQKKTSLYK